MRFFNKLTISHSDEQELKDFIDFYNDGMVCDAFLPMPVHVMEDELDAQVAWCNFNRGGLQGDVGVCECDAEFDGEEAVVSRAEGGQITDACCIFWTYEAAPLVLYKELLARGFSLSAVYFGLDEELCGVYQNGKHCSGRLSELLKSPEGAPAFGFAQKDQVLRQ
jgi:hypothetical protein